MTIRRGLSDTVSGTKRSTGRAGQTVLGRPADNGSHAGVAAKHVEMDLPLVEVVAGEQDDAVWVENGVIYLAKDHPVIQTQLSLWKEQYPTGTEGVVESVVLLGTAIRSPCA